MSDSKGFLEKIKKGTHLMSIKHLTISNASDFKTIIESPIFIGCNKTLQKQETLVNMWALSIDPDILHTLSINNFIEFIDTLLKKRILQLSQLKASCPVVFYLWFDEIAAQLRFNIISNFNVNLPFECSVEIVDSALPILKDFLESHYHEGISWSELEESNNDIHDDDELFSLKVFTLQINCKAL
jgi:hypothetical protein